MKKSFLLLMSIFILICGCNKVKPDPDKILAVIPAPVSIKGLEGDFVISEKTKIILGVTDDQTKLAADFLANLVRNSTGISLSVEEGKRASKGSVFMTIDTAIENDEGYILTVTTKKVIVKGGSAAGLFYGVQTIRQLMPAEAESPAIVEGLVLTIPACEIEDEPRFGYRGMHLDVGRHMFPSEYIHIGGDECPKTKWKKCPLCQKKIEEEGLENEHELQSYFIQRIEKFVLSKGKRIIGWDEILEGGLAPEATVMSWRGTTGGIEAAKQKHDVIMTPYTYVYLDYYQCEPQGEPLAIGGYLPLEKVYSYNPMPEELTPGEQKHILGVQGNLWSEYLKTQEHMEYMAYPRMFAIAESGWTPNRLKDFEDFLARIEILKKRYDAVGINYFKGEYRDTRKEKVV